MIVSLAPEADARRASTCALVCYMLFLALPAALAALGRRSRAPRELVELHPSLIPQRADARRTTATR